MNGPLSTYRVQLTQNFRFKDLLALVDYFHQLGISHLYFSPILQAKKGTTHGYDVTDTTHLNPEIGSQEEFEDLVEALHLKSLGILLDIVPNHMYIGQSENPWWNSVLEKGQKSPFASFFDIDWHPPKKLYDNKVFLPLLDQLFGDALENQTMKVAYNNGRFILYVKQQPLPTDPLTWLLILNPLKKEVEKIVPDVKELNEILAQLNSPNVSLRLETLFEQQPLLLERLNKQLETFNGIKGNPLSFNDLEKFIQAQHYRLCYWGVANAEINYRRFFDIFEFASIRVENKETFDKVHQLVFELLKKEFVQGLRIDHIDGLWDPLKYLEDLSNQVGDTFVVVEKILIGNEKLREEWPIEGTVGYDFLNQLNGLFVFQDHKQKFIDLYDKFTGLEENPSELKYSCKSMILNSSLASELHLLTLRLNAVAEKDRHLQDFPFETLKKALSEIIACFPVYRTYIQSSKHFIHEDDRKSITVAIERARRRNGVELSLYDTLENIFFFKYPAGVDEGYKEACGDFVMHFQQVTGPVMAKGLEDTALYRYFPLSSLNEVGGELDSFGLGKENFHKKNLERYESWPHSLVATTTHDTKRSEDVRARINLLSEIPDQWEAMITLWTNLNQKHKITLNNTLVPDHNEEYLLYQNLLGAQPFEGIDETFMKRLQTFMEKAIKEAKVNTSWLKPHEEYNQAVKPFIESICRDKKFLESFHQFSAKICELGMLNSLSQLILKLTSPGVPDIYQGNELWDFSLVDPDNRHPIDFERRLKLLKTLPSLEQCLKTPQDGRIKLFITQKLLHLRQQNREVFSEGVYLVLETQGSQEEHVIAFARATESKVILVISTRFFTNFKENFSDQNASWSDQFIALPEEFSKYNFRNIFNNKPVEKGSNLELNSLFSEMPFAVLESF